MLVLRPTWSSHFGLSGSAKRAGLSVAVGVLVGQKLSEDKPSPLKQLLLPLCVGGRVLSLQAMVDSGAQDSLLDQELAMQAGCVLETLPSPLPAMALDHRIIARVTHKTVPVTLVTSENNSAPILLVIPASKTSMFLSYPSGAATTPKCMA